MVRIVAAVTVVSTLASAKDDVILLQTKSFSSADAGQREALESMKTSMKDLLLDPDVMGRDTTTTFVSGMQAEIDAMKIALGQQNSEDNTAIADAVAVVNGCNTARQSAFNAESSGVEAKWTFSEAEIQAHAVCRAEEKTATNSETTKCDAKKSKASGEKTGLQNCLEAAGSPEDIAACLGPSCVEAPKLNTAIGHCDTAKETLNAKVSECDTLQTNAENAFCSFSNRMTDACSTFETCWTDGVAAYDALKTKFDGKLVSQNEMLKSITHIECLFDLFKSGSRLQASQVADCVNTDVAGTYTLDMTPVDAKDTCDTTRLTWNDANYAGLEGVMTRQAETQSLASINRINMCAP